MKSRPTAKYGAFGKGEVLAVDQERKRFLEPLIMNEHDSKIMAAKSKAVDDVDFVRRWRSTKWFCAACGRAGEITVHHLIGGRGGRSDEACNLLALCWEPCHMLAEGESIPRPIRGEFQDDHPGYLPKITLAIALAMKLRVEPEEYCEMRLTVLHGRRLPEPAEIPTWFETLFRRNRPEGFK